MRKIWVIAVVLAASVNLSPQSKAQQNSNDAQQKNKEISGGSDFGREGSKHAEDETKAPKNQSPSGDQTAQWILIIVGIVTAGIILYQSIATADAAKVANKGIDVSKTKERAKLSIKPFPLNPSAMGIPELRFTVVNAGESTAYMGVCLAGLHVSKNEEVPKDGSRTMAICDKTIAPGEIEYETTWFYSKPLARYGRDISIDGGDLVHFYGVVIFRDAFDDSWSLPFHYIWRHLNGHSIWIPQTQETIFGSWQARTENRALPLNGKRPDRVRQFLIWLKELSEE